jgi:phage virion morphogenesis protein
MGAIVEIKIDEIKKLVSKINSFALTPSKKKALLKDLGTEIIEQTIDRFDDNVAPDGKKWDPWKASTEAFYKKKFAGKKRGKGRRGGGNSLLFLSGNLQNNMERQVDGDTILVGSPMEYAVFHQEGTSKMAARPFLGLNAGNIQGLQDRVDEFMEKQTA